MQTSHLCPSPHTYLQRQIRNEAGDPEAHKQHVCKGKGSHGISDFLNLPVSFWLLLTSVEKEHTELRLWGRSLEGGGPSSD